MRASLSRIGARFALATLVAASAVVFMFVLEALYWSPSTGADTARLFQRSVGGLGMGAAATPAWSLFHFDPRLQPVDDSNLGPVPGSFPYSPASASGIIVFREPPREDLRITKVQP